MNVKKIELITDIIKLKAFWNNIVQKSNADYIFLKYEWLNSWIRTYGKENDQFIILIKEGEEIVSIAPLIIMTYKELGFNIRVLQFIGSSSSDYLDFIILKDHEECITMTFDFIQAHYNEWDFCELHHISDYSPNFTIFEKVYKLQKMPFSFYKESVIPYVPLDTSMEVFLKSRKTGLRYDLKKGESELNKIGKVEFTKIDNQQEAISELPYFLELLIKREKHTERPTSLEQSKRMHDFFKLSIENEDFWKNINFCKLSIDKKVIAYHFGFEYNKKMCWYKPTFNLEFIKFSPGKLLIKRAFEYALLNNFKEFDFLLGDEPYKYQWANCERNSYCITLSNKSLKSKFTNMWYLKIKPQLKQKKTLLKLKRRLLK
jgi:CelD/BcsL family acetyltransferase involved in cellulose biosynthesis